MIAYDTPRFNAISQYVDEVYTQEQHQFQYKQPRLPGVIALYRGDTKEDHEDQRCDYLPTVEGKQVSVSSHTTVAVRVEGQQPD